MGYKVLLKDYMRHVDSILGTNLVEVAALTNAVSARDLGELRTIAAELQRESFKHEVDATYSQVVHRLLSTGDISLEQLGKIEALNVGPANESIPEEAFSRIVKNMVKSEARS